MLISQDDEVASQCCVLRRGFSVYESTKRGAGPGSIIFPGYLQFAAQVRDAANRIEMTDPRSWTRWHTCVARQNGQRLVGHSCISPNADAGLHGLRRGEKPRSPRLDTSHCSCLPIVFVVFWSSSSDGLLRLAMAELLLFHLGLLASTSILGAVSTKASRMIFGAEDDWQ